VRLLATTSFATLVKLVPLEAGIPDPPGFSEELLEGRVVAVEESKPVHTVLLIRSELSLDRDWNFERLDLAGRYSRSSWLLRRVAGRP
jgi:hypothetical protein